MALEKIDRILLGDNPFNGVDHFSQARKRAREELDAGSIAQVIHGALDNGATGFVFSSTKKVHEALAILRESTVPAFGMYPIFPDVYSLVRLAADQGVLGAAYGMVRNGPTATGKLRTIFEGGTAALTADPYRILRTYLRAELLALKHVAPSGARVRSVFLHELISELIISFKMKEALSEFSSLIRDEFNALPGMVTRNFRNAMSFLNDVDCGEMVLMTPFNKVGFQMNPSREACESNLPNDESIQVIAMSILAGGYLTLHEAVDYVNGLPKPISCVVGVSSKEHATTTFSYLKERLAEGRSAP